MLKVSAYAIWANGVTKNKAKSNKILIIKYLLVFILYNHPRTFSIQLFQAIHRFYQDLIEDMAA